MTNVVQLYALEESHVPDEGSVRVARVDCETFEVLKRFVSRDPGGTRAWSYEVKNRTHFFGGSKFARDMFEVRQIIARA